MAKNSIDVYGASGKTNVLMFEPEALTLIQDPAHPLYDERVHLPLDEAMVLNVMELGIIQPIVVWKDPERGQTVVVAGRQRVKHAAEANRRLIAAGRDPIQIPATVRRGSAIKLAGLVVSENEIRQPDTPLGRAKKMAHMLERGYDEDDLALYFGCDPITIKNTLGLLDCTQAVQDAVEAGRIGVKHAQALRKLDPEQQRAKVQELIAAGEGVRPHERARRQAAVLGGPAKMRGKREILQALEDAERAGLRHVVITLRWVLNQEDCELPGAEAARQAFEELDAAMAGGAA